ncbi:hypothetical protein [Variovorax sp. YR566]|uniref:hypothetical protein n=1 Tax=Variovorax sp. YR566 TaxID=3450237 RepID=UPI003F7DBE7D
MSGQQARQFTNTQRFGQPEVSAAATVRTNQTDAIAAQVQGQGSALGAMGSALSGFFGTAAKTAREIGEIEHREQLVEIDRQNKARADQALADKAMERERDPELNKFQAYKGAYDTAVADSTANKLTQDLAVKLRDLPNDGSVDPRAAATEFLKSEIGPGTGDPAIDGRMVWAAKQKADVMVAQKAEQIAQTVESNIAQTITNDVTGKMLLQKGVTTGQTDAWHGQFLALTKGNIQAADKKFENALGSAIQNDGHAMSALAALRESGYAQRNPDSYLRLSEKAFHQTNKIKSFKAGEEVQSLNGQYTATAAEYHNAGLIMPTQTFLEFVNRAKIIDSNHGVGQGAFPWMTSGAFRENIKKQAEVNTILNTLNGLQSTGDLRQSVNETGAEIGTEIKKNYVPASAQWISQNPNRFPNLNRTMTSRGLPQPLADVESAREYGRMLSSPKEQSAFAYSVDDTTKGIISSGLMGSDVNETIKAVTLLNEVANGPNADLMLKGLIGDKEQARFDVIRRMTAGGTRDIETAVRATVSDKDVEKEMASEQESGVIKFSKLLRDPERKETDIDNDIQLRAGERLKERIGRDDWFGELNVNISGAALKSLNMSIADHLREQARTLKGGSKPDLNAAIDWATKKTFQSFVPLPVQGNTMSLVKDPYGGRGRSPDQEIASYNGVKVYSGARMNVGGKEEDPLETFMKIDRKALHEALPTFLGGKHAPQNWERFTLLGTLGPDTDPGSAESIYLLPPDAKSGLHPVMKPGGEPLMFQLGQQATFRNADGKAETLTIPTDRKEASVFLAQRLPKGFFPLEGAGGYFRVQYGYRLRNTEESILQDLSNARADAKANIESPTRPVQFEPAPIRRERWKALEKK